MLPVPTDEQLRDIAKRAPPGGPPDPSQMGRPAHPRLLPVPINREAFDRWLESLSESTNIEDRRAFDPTLPPPMPNAPPVPYQPPPAPDVGAPPLWRDPLARQRGGGLGIPQMNTAASQAHYSAINMRPAIGRAPGVHLMASSSIPGRTDRIPMRAAPGSYVLPADVVSGLGQGNTHAGARMWGQAIMAAAGPAGASTMGMRRGSIPKATVPRKMTSGTLGTLTKGFAQGGETDDDGYVPIVTAGGEMLIDPEIVAALGNGSEMLGKRTLAQSVLKVRKQVIDDLKKLPRPVA
jgi:hypothetical protein